MTRPNGSSARALAGAICSLAFLAAALLVGSARPARAACVVSGVLCGSPTPTPSHSTNPSPTPSHSATQSPTPSPTFSGGVPAPVFPTLPPFTPGPGVFPTFTGFPTQFPSVAPTPVFPQQQQYPAQQFFGNSTRLSQPVKPGSDPTTLRAILFLVAAGFGYYTLRQARVRRWQVGI